MITKLERRQRNTQQNKEPTQNPPKQWALQQTMDKQNNASSTMRSLGVLSRAFPLIAIAHQSFCRRLDRCLGQTFNMAFMTIICVPEGLYAQCFKMSVLVSLFGHME